MQDAGVREFEFCIFPAPCIPHPQSFRPLSALYSLLLALRSMLFKTPAGGRASGGNDLPPAGVTWAFPSYLLAPPF